MKIITDEQFKEAFTKAEPSEKQVFKKYFPEQFDDPYITACKKLGIAAVAHLADRSDKDLVSADAFYRLTICIRAKNMINGKLWEYVLDGVQQHWFPYWKKNAAGFGLTGADFGIWGTRTTVGERLEYRTKELLLEGVEEFNEYYQDYLAV